MDIATVIIIENRTIFHSPLADMHVVNTEDGCEGDII